MTSKWAIGWGLSTNQLVFFVSPGGVYWRNCHATMWSGWMQRIFNDWISATAPHNGFTHRMMVGPRVWRNDETCVDVWLMFTTVSQVHLRISSGQIIATSHDLTLKGSYRREIPLFQGNLGWWNIIIWPDKLERRKKINSILYPEDPWLSPPRPNVQTFWEPPGKTILKETRKVWTFISWWFGGVRWYI